MIDLYRCLSVACIFFSILQILLAEPWFGWFTVGLILTLRADVLQLRSQLVLAR